MGEYESKNKVNQNRMPDTRNYTGKHEKPGCLFMVLACCVVLALWIW